MIFDVFVVIYSRFPSEVLILKTTPDRHVKNWYQRKWLEFPRGNCDTKKSVLFGNESY
jgi:hypothetical protein